MDDGSGRRMNVGMMERQVSGCRTRGRDEVERVRVWALRLRRLRDEGAPWVTCLWH